MRDILLGRLSDEHLSRRLVAGEAAAFDELYRRYAHRLAVYGRQLLGDGASGEDVAQVALLKAYQALRRGSLPERMRPWLYRIAHNAAIDMLGRRRELLVAATPEEACGRSESAAAKGLLLAALGRLPERQRQAWLLREVNGLRIGEIAKELGLRVEQVEQALFAARNRLAEELVFGERLDCESVRRLGQGPLDRTERRALHRHLRSCAGCRGSVSLPGLGAVLPLPLLAWLRQAAGILGGAGAPAVKTGALVATAALAGGIPLATHVLDRGRVAGVPAMDRLMTDAAGRPHAETSLATWRPRAAVHTGVATSTSAGGVRATGEMPSDASAVEENRPSVDREGAVDGESGSPKAASPAPSEGEVHESGSPKAASPAPSEGEVQPSGDRPTPAASEAAEEGSAAKAEPDVEASSPASSACSESDTCARVEIQSASEGSDANSADSNP